MDIKKRFCYWEEGMNKPDTLPPDCEWSENGSDKWFQETSNPKYWAKEYRSRWPCRMDAFDDLFIRTCKNHKLNTVFRFKCIMAKRCALKIQYAGMYNVTMHLWDIIQKYNLAPDMNKVVQEFMRPLYAIDLSTYNGLCSTSDYPDFTNKGDHRNIVLASFIIARNIIRYSEASKFTDLSIPAWFRNKAKK